jgi:hypothetical protein
MYIDVRSRAQSAKSDFVASRRLRRIIEPGCDGRFERFEMQWQKQRLIFITSR